MSLEDFARYIDEIAPGPAAGRSSQGTAEQADQAGRRHRGPLAATAVLAVLVVAIGAVLFAARTGDELGSVMTGPDRSTRTWIGPALLAPTGVDWTVEYWGHRPPGSEGDPTVHYNVRFDHDGYSWSLMAYGPGVDESPGTFGEIVQAGSREVTVSESSRNGNFLLGWTESNGTQVSLSLGRPTDAGSDGQTGYPAVDQALALVETIEEVPLDTWTAALTPPDGVADPLTGSEQRPPRLGVPGDESATLHDLIPWNYSSMGLAAGGALVELDSNSDPAGLVVEGSLDDPAMKVRGVSGSIRRAPLADMGPNMLPSEGEGAAASVLTWVEGRTRMSFWYPATVTDEDAVAFADSLVVLDDAQWEELLYPANLWRELPGPHSVDGTTGTTTEPMCSVLSAVTDIPAGTSGADMVDLGMVEVESMPAQFLPATALTDVDQLAATSATTPFEIKANTILVEGMLPIEPLRTARCEPTDGACVSDPGSTCYTGQNPGSTEPSTSDAEAAGTISLGLYSGLRDPVWSISSADFDQVLAILGTLEENPDPPATPTTVDPTAILGFRGLVMTYVGAGDTEPTVLRVHGTYVAVESASEPRRVLVDPDQRLMRLGSAAVAAQTDESRYLDPIRAWLD